jgi:hypothetical protein
MARSNRRFAGVGSRGRNSGELKRRFVTSRAAVRARETSFASPWRSTSHMVRPMTRSASANISAFASNTSPSARRSQASSTPRISPTIMAANRSRQARGNPGCISDRCRRQNSTLLVKRPLPMSGSIRAASRSGFAYARWLSTKTCRMRSGLLTRCPVPPRRSRTTSPCSRAARVRNPAASRFIFDHWYISRKRGSVNPLDEPFSPGNKLKWAPSD